MEINCKQSKFSKLWADDFVDADNDLCLALEDHENYVSVYLSLEEISILQKHLVEVLKPYEISSSDKHNN